jgi:two-component system OmpR family response regulator
VQPTSKILIIDHEPLIAELLINLLTEAGYTACAATDDAGALFAIARHSPALLLLDVGHNSRHGIKVIEHIHAVGLATIPLVVMTTAPRDVAPLLTPGVVESLAKPFNIDALLACVARYVQPLTADPA